METSQVVNIEDIVDQSPLSRFQIVVLSVCAVIVAIDGFDTAAIGYIAPAVRQEWGLSLAALAPAFSASLFGLMFGAFLIGPLADRHGRKRIMLLAVAIFAIGTLVSAAANSLGTLVALRFFTGLGLGAAMPTSIALTSEFAPKRHRMFLVTLSFCGFSAGFALGGEVAARLIEHYGWRSVLLLGGAVPLALLPLLALALPESVRFLAAQPHRQQALQRVVQKISGDTRWLQFTIRTAGTEPVTGAPFPRLLSRDWRRATLSLWVAYFCSLFVFYLLSSWLPTIMREAGYSIGTAARIAAMAPLGGTIGAILLARLMDRFNPFLVLAAAYVCSSAALLAIGQVIHSVTMLAIAVFCAGFGAVGAQTGMNALAATLYPTQIRATGVSWALAMGRAGSIVGAMSGGVLMAWFVNAQSLFQFIAVPPVLGGIALAFLAMARSEADGRSQAQPMPPHS